MKQMFHFDEKTNKILSLFFDRPSERFHLRELSRLVKISPATVSRKLRKLLKLGILKLVRTKPILEVEANMNSQKFREAKRDNNIKKISSSGLLNFLIKCYNYPEAIILFGSYAKGDDIEKSDVDIAVITNKKINPNISIFEKKLNRRIHILEIQRKNIKPTLMNNLANGIVLYGFLKVK